MPSNKQTIERYIDGFNKSDHQQILSCLTDDVVWEMPGLFHLEGQQQFDGEIENPAFNGTPVITILRLAEEGNIVVVEGTVEARTADGPPLRLNF